MSVLRVLVIPEGKEVDAEGRSLGDDWLVADLGHDTESNSKVYITTDRIRGSELGQFPILDPKPLAEWVVEELNERISKAMAGE